MDEEKMWKGYYDQLQEMKMNPITEHESKLQDADGGFFEKFGSLLRQKSHLEEVSSNATAVLSSLEEVRDDDKSPNDHDLTTDDDDIAPAAIDNDNENDDAATGEEEATVVDNFAAARIDAYDLGRERILDENIIQLDDSVVRERKEEFVEKAVGMNIEDLYEEILFEILNNIGCNESDGDVCSEKLLEYAQEAFKISNGTHAQIYEMVQQKEPPKLRLNVEIIKAENLLPKDSNGLSDPFVTLYLQSNSSHRYNTSVKLSTLNPCWKEHFSLPIADNSNLEILIVEVWDFDAAETVQEKFGKLFEIKGVRGLRKLMKEIAVTASSGKHDNELIGRSSISLKSIPVAGIRVWCNLEKGSKGHNRSRGSILVNLCFNAEKNSNVAVREHRHLLRILLMHELETSQVAKFWWSGKFNAQGEAIRSQHSVQSGLTQYECALSQWVVYANIHEEHPLSFTLFNSILDLIAPHLSTLDNEKCDSDDAKSFWDGTKRILPSCYTVVRKIRAKTAADKHIVKTLSEVLDIIAKISTFHLPARNVIDLFPSSVYGWKTTGHQHNDDDNNDDNGGDDAIGWSDVKGVLVEAIHAGSMEYLSHVIESNKPSSSHQSDDDRLQYLIRVIQLIRTDLQRAIEYFNRYFYQKLQLNYAEALFKYYDGQVTEIVKADVIDVCGNIKRLDLPDSDDLINQSLPNMENINMGTTLFELYLVLKRFLMLGRSICPTGKIEIETYYEWFTPGVTHWLDISALKALTRIEKAIELDTWAPVDETVKHSSSAVDTLSIFHQIKIFWQQLDWPDVESSYAFLAKIVDDICRCCVFYADRIGRRVESISGSSGGETSDEEFAVTNFCVTNEWCFAINNIDHIQQSLPTFIKQLGTDLVIAKLGEIRTTMEADRCAATLKNVIDNAIDTEGNKIMELIEVVARKMEPSIRRYLVEGAEVLHENSYSMEKLLMYLEKSLETLNSGLSEINFERMLTAIWAKIPTIMTEIIRSSLINRRPPAFFRNLRETLLVMMSSFMLDNKKSANLDALNDILRTLNLHASETEELIHQYYEERMQTQNDASESPYGKLTIKAWFSDNNNLHLMILNARNLVPMDSNGSCDSFVKVHFLPANAFLGIHKPKTAVQHKNLFPLYDEHFKIPLTNEQIAKDNSLLVFSVKDKDLFGMSNQYIAESYISFAYIKEAANEQILMNLSRPEYTDSDVIRALEIRQGDKQAKDFLKKLKTKSQ